MKHLKSLYVGMGALVAGGTLFVATDSQACWKDCELSQSQCSCADSGWVPDAVAMRYSNGHVGVYLLDGIRGQGMGLDANGHHVVSCLAVDATPNSGWVWDTAGCENIVKYRVVRTGN